MVAPSVRWHQAVHGTGPSAYRLPLRLWFGSPTWAKVGGALGIGYIGYEVFHDNE